MNSRWFQNFREKTELLPSIEACEKGLRGTAKIGSGMRQIVPRPARPRQRFPATVLTDEEGAVATLRIELLGEFRENFPSANEPSVGLGFSSSRLIAASTIPLVQ